MAEPTAVIEMIKRIIADDTADMRERLQHLESRLNQEGVRLIGGNGAMAVERSKGDVEQTPQREDGGDPPPQAEQMRELLQQVKEMEERCVAIKEMHSLDATPVQWTRSADGKMVEAPDGMWDISCLACTHKTVWCEGDKKPPQCKTWRLANGETVQ